MVVFVVLNFTTNTGKSLIQNKETIGHAKYYFSVAQETISAEKEPEKDASQEKKSKQGAGQILKDIKKFNRKRMTSDFSKRCKKE